MNPEIEALARRLYTERGTPQGPTWEQLGETTRELWRETAAAVLFEDLA